jgi:hypothetical protein
MRRSSLPISNTNTLHFRNPGNIMFDNRLHEDMRISRAKGPAASCGMRPVDDRAPGGAAGQAV